MPDQTYQPTLSQLRAFVAIAQYRHFGTAATRLNVSQPTLSQALVSLESGLGVKLIERSTRRVLVTAAGERLLPHAKAALEATERLIVTSAGMGDRLSGPVRMGLIPTVAPYVLPSLLPAIGRQFPDVALQVIEEQTAVLLDRLRNGSLDVAVVAIPNRVAGIEEIPLYHEDFVLVVPRGHRLDGSSALQPVMLGALPLLLLDEGHCLRDQTLDLCRSVDAHPESVGDTRAASLSTVVQCVAGGLGVTLIPEMALPVETARADLGVVRFADPKPGRTIGLVFRASSMRGGDYEQLAELMRDVRVSAAA